MRKYNRSYMRPATQGREISKFEVLTTTRARTENISFLCRAKFSQSRVTRAARLFSSINQWCHCFVALGLSSTSSSVSRTGKIIDKLVSSEATQEVWDLLVQDRGIFLTPTERAVLYCNCRWWHCNKKKQKVSLRIKDGIVCSYLHELSNSYPHGDTKLTNGKFDCIITLRWINP